MAAVMPSILHVPASATRRRAIGLGLALGLLAMVLLVLGIA
ncbi:MAG: hypothetical protein JWP29_721, partial [Rhodoferax sp.]|nr:hypothetical protein [Rhodoferax sp.]